MHIFFANGLLPSEERFSPKHGFTADKFHLLLFAFALLRFAASHTKYTLDPNIYARIA